MYTAIPHKCNNNDNNKCAVLKNKIIMYTTILNIYVFY